MKFQFDDGGREKAGYQGHTRDCVCRAISIATGKPYEEVYNGLISLKLTAFRQTKKIKHSHPRTGVNRKIYDAYLKFYGWQWTPTMKVGQGCKVHLRENELPKGTLVVRLSKHLTTVIDGVIHDTYNPANDGIHDDSRCVYGYYQKV